MAMAKTIARRAVATDGFGPKSQICSFWLRGKCSRNPCRFKHSEILGPRILQKKRPYGIPSKHSASHTWRNPDHHPRKTTKCVKGEPLDHNSHDPKKAVPQEVPQKTSVVQSVTANEEPPRSSDVENVISEEELPKAFVDENVTSHEEAHLAPEAESEEANVQEDHKTQELPPTSSMTLELENVVPDDGPKQCKYWANGSCVNGECHDLHSWFHGSGLEMLEKLEGHSKAVTGIALPSGSDKLYSGSQDNSLRVWDCHSGQCTATINTNAEIRSIITKEGPWLFVGLPNGVKVWNSQTHVEFFLNSHDSVICCMDMDETKLFAGMEDGSILVWEWNRENVDPEPCAVLKGHTGAVCSIIAGAGDSLYSSSKDCTIKQWNRRSLNCLQTLEGHKREVTSVITWEEYLISGSVDRTIKVWGADERGDLGVVYEMQVDSGIVGLVGKNDREEKPVMLCSCSDSTVRLFEVPSFRERGRIFSKSEVRTMSIGIDRLLFLGDSKGRVSVWNLF